MSDLEHKLAFQLRALKMPEPEKEYRFAMHHVGRGKAVDLIGKLLEAKQ